MPGSDQQPCRRGTRAGPWPVRRMAWPTCMASSAGAMAVGGLINPVSTPGWPSTWTGSKTGYGPLSGRWIPPETAPTSGLGILPLHRSQTRNNKDASRNPAHTAHASAYLPPAFPGPGPRPTFVGGMAWGQGPGASCPSSLSQRRREPAAPREGLASRPWGSGQGT